MEIHDQAAPQEGLTVKKTATHQEIPVVSNWPQSASPRSGPLCVRSCTDDWPIHEMVLSGELSRRYAHVAVRAEAVEGGSVETTVGEYFARIESGTAAGTYLKDWRVSENLGDFVSLPLPGAFDSWFDDLPIKSRPAWNWIFVGPAGSASPTHVDIMCSSAWNLLVSGQKAWTFQSPLLAAQAGILDLELAEVSGHTETAFFTFLQQPGDVVIVPGGWAHSVQNLEETVSITGNWINDSNAELVKADLAISGMDRWYRLLVGLEARQG